jgi:hypothetical protein
MPIVKEPRPLPSPPDYVPPTGVPYEVSSGDSWDVLAQRPDIKNAGVSSSDLCYFNFKTRHPAEINWYLYHKVGCRHVTRDHANYMFSMADDPGIVYLPKAGVILPVHETKEEPPLNAWLGLVVKAGTMFVVDGIETVTGAVFSLDDPTKWMLIGASVNRLGLGWGATGGVSFILVTGVSRPEQLNGYQDMSTDFNVALGKNWGKMVQGEEKFKKFKPIIDAMGKLGANTPSGLKKMIKTKPDRYFDLVKAVKSVRDYGNLKADGDPEVFMWDVPFVSLFGELGAELSVFKSLTTFNAIWDGTQ